MPRGTIHCEIPVLRHRTGKEGGTDDHVALHHSFAGIKLLLVCDAVTLKLRFFYCVTGTLAENCLPNP